MKEFFPELNEIIELSDHQIQIEYKKDLLSIKGNQTTSMLHGEQEAKKSEETAKKTFSENNKYVGKYLIIWVRINNEEVLRLGIIASKKMHNKANKRNFAKRRIFTQL